MKKEKKMIDVYPFKVKSIIIIGCSAGPDSMALFDMLLKIRKDLDLKLVCAHVNHNLRKESKKEAEFLEDFSEKNNVQFEAMKIEKYGDDNFHNEARSIRYRFFEDLVKKYDADYLVTAHHGDDLIETILMRLVRGSTIHGYMGFKKEIQKEGYLLVRPLIEYTKEELLNYNEKNHVDYFTDSSNKKDTYTRNRYRKHILPFLKSEEENVHEKFFKFSQELDEVSNFVDQEVHKWLKKAYNNNELHIDKFLEMDPFLQKQLIYKILADLYQDDLILLNDQHFHLIIKLIQSRKKNTKIYLPNEMIVLKSYDKLTFTKITDEISAYEIELDQYSDLPNGHHIELLNECEDHGNNVIYLDQEEIKLPLIVRTRKLGDKMTIKNKKGHTKLKDLFIDQKIPKEERDLWPVITDSTGEILFVPGLKKSKFDKNKNEKYDIIIKYD